MTASGVDGDFTACDTTLLNRFFADYLKEHTQGGANTLQRNLAHLFEWLDQAYDHPNLYTDRLHRRRHWTTGSRSCTAARRYATARRVALTP